MATVLNAGSKTTYSVDWGKPVEEAVTYMVVTPSGTHAFFQNETDAEGYEQLVAQSKKPVAQPKGTPTLSDNNTSVGPLAAKIIRDGLDKPTNP